MSLGTKSAALNKFENVNLMKIQDDFCFFRAVEAGPLMGCTELVYKAPVHDVI